MSHLIDWVFTVTFGGVALFFAVGTVCNALDVPKGDESAIRATLIGWVLTGLSLAATIHFLGAATS